MTKPQIPSREEVTAWARNSGFGDGITEFIGLGIFDKFAALAYAAGAEAEREAIMDEWWMCVQSDLENGVKSLNECASEKWRKEYPEISKFAATIEARKDNNA